MVIDCDLAALKSMDYHDYNQNIEYYIEHLASETGLKEKLLPDYYMPDIPSNVQNMPEGHENRGQKIAQLCL